MNYYSLHIGDYAAHTQRLSLMEDLAYRRMIDCYYLNERPFSGCSTDVAREVGMIEQLAAVEYVLLKFFVLVDGSFSNKRCDDEILKYRAKIEQASNAGKASVQRRLVKSSTGVEISSTDVQLTNNQEPVTKNQEPIKTKPLNRAESKTTVAALPAWLDSAIWEKFCEHRGSKFTDFAKNLAIKKLDDFRLRGHDPTAVLEETILNGWKGIFEPKNNGAKNGNDRDADRRNTIEQLTGKPAHQRTIVGDSRRVD